MNVDRAKVHHVVRLRNIPYGFFEMQLHGYFSQFGGVKKVRVLRSRKGHYNGIGFVEFENGEVAKIAAQTMDNYLLAEKRMRCKVLEQKEVPRCIHQKGRLFAKIPKVGENQVKHAKKHFKIQTPEQEKRQMDILANNLRKRMTKLRAMGINYEFNFEKKLHEAMATVEAKGEAKEEEEGIMEAEGGKESENGREICEKEENEEETKPPKSRKRKKKGETGEKGRS